MRIVAVHRDALVVTSRLWQTTATVLRAGEEALLIDSPYFPDELEALPAVFEQSGFRVDALIATHADFDHVLGRLAFPGLALGVGESTALRLRAEPGAAQRDLCDFDDHLYVTRERPLSLGQVQSLPVPGRLELGERELELHVADGHTSDGTAVFDRETGVLCPGDYLSDVEIPMIHESGSLAAYRSTLNHLAGVANDAEVIVPGHGSPRTREDALRTIEEDLAYLDALERGEEKPGLPEGRDTREQRRVHRRNLANV